MINDIRILQAAQSLNELQKSKLMPRGEIAALAQSLKSEEGISIAELIANSCGTFQKLPKSYETQDQVDPIVYMHYFIGSLDWYITENATEASGEDVEVFGLVKSECCPDGELGYINLPEITNAGAELDLYFTPAALSTFKK